MVIILEKTFFCFLLNQESHKQKALVLAKNGLYLTNMERHNQKNFLQEIIEIILEKFFLKYE